LSDTLLEHHRASPTRPPRSVAKDLPSPGEYDSYIKPAVSETAGYERILRGKLFTIAA
jgi:hypothetical protein